MDNTPNGIKQLIQSCGGSGQVAKKLGLSRFTVLAWIREKNIPLRHWASLMKLNTNLTASEIGQVCFYDFNCEVDLE